MAETGLAWKVAVDSAESQGSPSWQELGEQISCDVDMSKETADITSKSSGGWSDKLEVRKAITMSCEGFVSGANAGRWSVVGQIATLVDLAGADRVAVTIGSGFTGRLTLGHRPLPWSYVREYVTALRGLLNGERVEWEGKTIEMMHPAGFGAPRPIAVPILIAAAGPKGIAAAAQRPDPGGAGVVAGKGEEMAVELVCLAVAEVAVEDEAQVLDAGVDVVLEDLDLRDSDVGVGSGAT